ncbi:Translin-associated factor X-interacting protein 1 [Dinochytrium kinnereticum]|nr:Translin-associated factor X-interacting protein 1 [Dinochytrium kinnereticum]
MAEIVSYRHLDQLANVPTLSKSSVKMGANFVWPPNTPMQIHSRASSRAQSRCDDRDTLDVRSTAVKRVMHPGDKTQPTFLLAMMNYIRSELIFLGSESAVPGDSRRLQVYREAFDAFIHEFKTYEPILSEIKNEYEMALTTHQALVEELEPLRCKVAIGRFEATQELMRLKNELSSDLQRLDEANRNLQSEKDSMESEIRILNGQIASLSEELRHNENAIQSEEMARKRLRDFQEQLEVSEKHFQDSLAQKDEELLELRKAVKKAVNELTMRENEISKLMETIKDCVSIAEMKSAAERAEAVEAQNVELRSKVEKMESELEDLKSQCRKKDKQLQAAEADKLPDWEYIAYNCPGPIHEWGVLCRGMDFNDTIVVLVRQLLLGRGGKSAKSDPSKEKEDEKRTPENRFFVGLGVGSEVPKYLRYRGKIPNRRLSKKDCILLINDTWKAKSLYDVTQKQKGPRTLLPDFLFMYLKKRFGTQDVIAEWGYNLLFASQRNGFHSVQCQLFHEILTDAMDESVYHHQQAMIEYLKSAFQKFDSVKHEGKPRGLITKVEAGTILKEFWPWKSKEMIDQLISAMEADQTGDTLTYHWLFHNDTDSLFLEVVREQDMELREKYLTDLTEKIRAITKDPRVSATDILRCLASYDPLKSRKEIDAYLSRGFQIPSETIKPRSMVMVDSFIKNLRKGVIEKAYKKESSAAT